MKENLKHKILMGAIAFLCVMVCTCFYIVDIRTQAVNSNYDTSFCNMGYGYDEQVITNNVIVKQSFSIKDNISGIKLGIKSNSKKTRGNLIVKLYDKDSKILVSEWKIKFDENTKFEYDGDSLPLLMNNSNYNVLNPGVYNKYSKTKKEYTLEITSDSEDPDTAPCVYVSKEKTYNDGNLFVNYSEHNSDLWFKVVSKGSHFINTIYMVICAIISIFIIFLYYLIFIKKCNIKNIFLISSLIIGFIYMIIMTPYSVSDEEGHITTAYRYSNVILGNGYQTENGNMLKRKCDIREYGLDTIPSESTYKAIIDNFFDKVSEEDKELCEVPGDHIGNLWQYIPASLGITIARVMNVGYIPLVYMARLFNFMFFIGLIYLAIKKIPFGKITMYTIAMLPMTLHQGMSCSYDSIVYGISFLFISYCIYIAFTKDKIKKTDILVLALSGGILSTCKAGIFIFICFACLIIPKSKFKNKKNYYKTIAGIILCAVSMLLIFNFVKVTKAVTVTSNDNLQNFSSVSGYTYKNIIESPLNFTKIAFNTIRESGDFLFMSTFGQYLSWSTVRPIEVPVVIIICYIIITIISALKVDGEEKYFNFKNKLIFLTISITIFFVFMVVAFTWTPNTQNVIFGLQGRYYVEILPLLVFLFRNNTIVLKKNINRQIMYGVCILQFITVLNLFVNIIK